MAFPLEIVNMSVIGTEILKDFYWQQMDIKTLNDIFLNAIPGVISEAHLTLPPMPRGSNNVEILLHVFNNSDERVFWEFKRIQLCKCKLQQFPSGINHFQKKFDCLHRDLVNIWPSTGSLNTDGKGMIDIHLSYGSMGTTVLGYKMIVCEIFEIDLYFHVMIVDFDPLICVVTKTLTPICVKTVEPPIQPIWIHNFYQHELTFQFSSKETSLKILNKSLEVESGQTAPLLVQFTPYLLEKELLLEMCVHGVLRQFSVIGIGISYPVPLIGQMCPKLDLLCEQDPFTVYRNYVPFNIDSHEHITKMVVLRNMSQDRVNFKWSKYEISKILNLKVEPEEGFVKARHSKQCYITVEAKAEAAVIKHIPLLCKVFKPSKQFQEVIKMHPEDRKPQDLPKGGDILLRKLLVNISVIIQTKKVINVPSITQKVFLSHEDKNPTQSIDEAKPDIENSQALDKWMWKIIHDEEYLGTVMNRRNEDFFNLLPDCDSQTHPSKKQNSSHKKL